jgi:hypothetical protein
MIKRLFKWLFKNNFDYTLTYIDDRGAIQSIDVSLPNAPNVNDRITFRDLNNEVHFRKVKCINWYINVDRGHTGIYIELQGFD